MTELKPCPFCGGKDLHIADMGYPHFVYCLGCGAKMTSNKIGLDGNKDAVKKWNNRTEMRADK